MKTSAKRVRERFLAAISENDMLKEASRILVALSGGADSTALLLLMCELAKERAVPLAALHVNHMIRGEEADRDEQFCRALCRSLEIPLHVERVDIPALAKAAGKGIEECARDFRYDAIRSLCAAHSYNTAALAHNADDNAETILFHLTRGTSLRGISGIPPVREDGGYRIIRPLITCEKRDICAFLRERGQDWVEDTTNCDTSYTRNRIRQEIIPILKEINPSLSDTFTAFSCSTRRDDIFLSDMAEAHRLSDGRASLSRLNDALLSRLLHLEWSRHRKNGQLTAIHLEHMMRLIRGEKVHASLSLPGGVVFRLERETVHFLPQKGWEEPNLSVQLQPGANHLPNDSMIYAVWDDFSTEQTKDINAAINIYKLAIQESLDSGKIRGAVYVRSRLEGDRILCGGIHHKIKTLFSDRKLPLDMRRRYPVVCDDDGILLIPGIACRDGVKAISDTRTVLRLYFFAHKA